MDTKKLGVMFIIISLVFLGFLFYFNSNLSVQANDIGCNPGGECVRIEKAISVTHIGFGFFGFMIALGFYILFFSKSEQAILKRLDEQKIERSEEEKFDLILKALDSYEKKVLRAVKEQDGITQSTLRLRTDMSKAKLSYVLQGLEKKNLIKRFPKGKTLKVHLKI